MPDAPVACSLSAPDARARGQEWRRFVADRVTEVVRSGPSVRLRLPEDGRVVLAAVDLARREKECCPFLDIRLRPLPGALWLEIEAPEHASTILDDLTGPAA